MPSVLHLLSNTADEQTRHIHQMLSVGLGSDFNSTTHRLGTGGPLRNLPGAIVQLRRERSDITFAWGIAALAAAVLSGQKRIVFSPDRFAGPRALRWIRSIMGRGNVTFVAPTFTQRRLAIQHAIHPDHCMVIQPGVDFGQIKRRGNPALRSALGLSAADYVIIAPGESSIPAGHDQAVWTCGILNVLDSRYKLVLWGRGKRAESTTRLASRLKQTEMVKSAEHILDRPMDFAELLSIADVCLSTPAGVTPTLPIATAMAGGVPIVSTVTYALAELLEDRHTALMVPTRSPRALAQRVLDLRDDPSLQARLCDTARAEAYEHFSMTRMLDRYRDLLSPKSPT
jgi:glycosyltransferase involved in cell wall biosynthesis